MPHGLTEEVEARGRGGAGANKSCSFIDQGLQQQLNGLCLYNYAAISFQQCIPVVKFQGWDQEDGKDAQIRCATRIYMQSIIITLL